MKKVYNLLLIMALPSILVLYSYNSGSPGGKSGSPGDGGSTCTQCHSGTAQPQTDWITTNIPEEGFTAGITYTIVATGTHTGVSKFGFELTAEDGFGTKVGTLSITDPSRTKFTNANHSVTHTSGGTSVSGDSNTWSMDWTAPSDLSVVTFYAAFNAANGNGTTTGDVIYTTSATYDEFIVPNPMLAGVEPDHEQQGYEGELSITGSETEWTSGVSDVSFVNHDDNSVTFSASVITVIGNDLLSVEVVIPEDIVIGVYDVHVDELMLESGFTVDIYDDIADNYLVDNVSVYPNPVADIVSINVPDESKISIVDISGRIVGQYKSKKKSNLQIDVSMFDSGLYFVQVFHKGNKITKKLLVK